MDVVTGAMGSLLPKLGKLLEEEDLFKGAKEDIQSIKDELESMHAFLRKVAKVPPDQLNEQVKLLARDARALSYRIEDSVDRSLNFQTTKHEVRHNMSHAKLELKDVRNKMNELRDLDSLDVVIDIPAAYAVNPRLKALHRHEAEFVGLESEIHWLIRSLTEGDGMLEQKVKTLSIVGHRGLGKTTLANVVYHMLKSQFDCEAFVSVCRKSNMKEIFKSMLYQLDEKKQANIHDVAKDVTQLAREISELLQNQRYLIVLDDLWHANVWDSIRRILPHNYYGSTVITTTLLNSIAAKCCSGPDDLIYKMCPLTEESSYLLFLRKTFGSEAICPDELREFIPEVLKKCRGTPLAIISIASLLSSTAETTKESWQAIIGYLRSAFECESCVEFIGKILSLSYFHLPNSLKTCLLYLAASAKNQRIKRHNLVRKWIAEGFLSEHGRHSREKVANSYFDELINRNVIQLVEYGNCPPGEETYEIHDLVIDFFMVMAKEHFVTFFPDFGISGPHTKPAYLLFIQCSDSGSLIDAARMDLSHVRSVTIFGPAKLVSFKKLEYIRVLDLDGCEDLDNTDVDDICRMILLRYLSLKQTRVTELPPQIGNLRYLETLVVRQTQITELPPEIVKLENLETLDVRQTRLTELPKELNQLPNLTHLHFGEELTVELRDNQLLSTGNYHDLKSLTIIGDSNPSDELHVPPSLSELRMLKVAGRFVKVPEWIALLGALTLIDIRVCKLEPNDLRILGGLPRLINLALVLICLPRKQIVITSSAGFVNLKVFTFDCRVPWVTFQQRAMPRLKHLELKLYAGPAGKSPSGIVFLRSLNMVILRYALQYASSDRVTETVDFTRKEAGSHANLIVLYVNGVQEIFPSNASVDRRISGNEIEE